jgi:mono/diheme cytochrome c family protein
MKRRLLLGLLAMVAVAVVAAGFFALVRLIGRDPEPRAADVRATPTLIARGEYLTRAADCAACHSVPGGAPFAGGFRFKLPFGTLYSTNITADRVTGIGAWSDDDFVRALHDGVAKGGANLYPAFPYTAYSALSRDDAVAIKAYLFSLPPVRAPPRPNHLIFPFNQRWGLALWNLAFLDRHRFRPDPRLDVSQNRGRYLATALGHCGECHTPRTLAYSVDGSHALAGAPIEGWRAYNLTSSEDFGLGRWSDAEIAAYLNTGHSPAHGSAGGPMGEVVVNSLQYLTAQDTADLVKFLRTVKPQNGVAADRSNVQRGGPTKLGSESDRAPDALGRHLYTSACSGCHLLEGGARQSRVADFVGGRTVGDPQGSNLIHILLSGSDQRTLPPSMYMPSFGSYSDDELAAVANFVINRFSGHEGAVTAKSVRAARRDTAS